MIIHKTVKNFIFVLASLAILAGGTYLIIKIVPTYFEKLGLRLEVKTRPVAPDFTLNDSEGKPVKLSDFRGQKVVLHFWVSWNDFSSDSVKALESYHKSLPDNEIILLLINSGEDEKTIRKFAESNGVSSKILADEDGEAAELYRLSFSPLTVFIDRSGLEGGRVVGPLSAEGIKNYLNGL